MLRLGEAQHSRVASFWQIKPPVSVGINWTVSTPHVSWGCDAFWPSSGVSRQGFSRASRTPIPVPSFHAQVPRQDAFWALLPVGRSNPAPSRPMETARPDWKEQWAGQPPAASGRGSRTRGRPDKPPKANFTSLYVMGVSQIPAAGIRCDIAKSGGGEESATSSPPETGTPTPLKHSDLIPIPGAKELLGPRGLHPNAIFP